MQAGSWSRAGKVRLALASSLVAPVKLRQGWAMPPPLKQKTESRSAQLPSLGVSTCPQLVPALEDWGMQDAEARGLDYLGGEIYTKNLTARVPRMSSIYYPVLLGLPHLWFLPFSFCISLELEWGVLGNLRLRQREERGLCRSEMALAADFWASPGQ